MLSPVMCCVMHPVVAMGCGGITGQGCVVAQVMGKHECFWNLFKNLGLGYIRDIVPLFRHLLSAYE